ncbi:MAG: indole-3-glycerol phosphate synthase TrpC [Prevotella sp.]|jgi:indole-3-glycerol phosphate synthase|nr:indole-3-glycerol phosphate synthase TrpC [Prevotella sp.]
MSDILEEIVAWKRRELEIMKEMQPTQKLQRIIEEQTYYKRPPIADALKSSSTGIIAEFKRKSPSLGWINEDAKASDIPFSYQQNGAAALSILTDNRYFGGDDEFVKEARMSGVRIPVLYKNFVIDEHQLLQARLCGASTVLLIAACLDFYECKRLLLTAHSLGLEVLLEMHSEEELVYAELEPDLYGINNRHLGSFQTDVETSFRLVDQLPENSVKVSESGISNPATVRALREAGFEGFLIGEAFMKTDNPGKALAEFISKI